MTDFLEEGLLSGKLEHLKDVLDRAGTGTFELDPGTGMLRASPLACELHGIVPCRGLSLDEFLRRIHPEDLPRLREAIDSVSTADGTGFFKLEYRVAAPTHERWVQVSGRALNRAPVNSEPSCVVGVMSDVTDRKKHERSAISMEAILEAIGKSTDACIYAKDRQGRMLYCNDAVLRGIGRSREEVIGHTDAEFFAGDPNAGAIISNDALVLREGGTVVFTEVLESIGKKFLSTKTPFYDADHNLIGVAGVSIDITELESTRQALADVEERASMAAEAAEIGIYDWDPRNDRLVWSEALRKQFGLDLGEEVTLNVALERVHPEDRERVANAVQRALDPAGDGHYNIEYRTVPTAAQPQWVHVVGRVRFEDCDGQRQAVRFFGVSVNITKQKQLEEDLRFQLQLTRNITDNATTAIMMMDERGRCTFMNPAAEKVTGYTLAEVAGGMLHDFIHHHHPDGRPYPAHECPIDRALPEQFDVVAHEDVFVRKNGEFFPVVVNAKPIRKGGRLVGTVIEVRDVTVERETIQRLRELSLNLAEADRRKDDFLATLAHELRNPLAPIRTASSLLGSAALPAERLSWASQVINRQVTHMARLLEDLMDVARITRGKLSIERHRATLRDIVDAAVESARPLLDEKRHRLRLQVPQGETAIWVDACRVSQILGNLLTNAARYTGEGGTIELRALFEGNDLVLSVCDNGAGLEPDELENIFEMFRQGKAGSSASGGLGIGLGLSRALAQLHGGDLTARSDGAGRGSEFALRLPAVLAGPTQLGPERAPGAAAGSLRVLLADDNRDAVDALAMMLQIEGHDVRAVYGGRSAVETARKFKPHAVVLDIGMPDMTGYEVARTLKREAWARETLFVAVTGWGQQADKELARHVGFDSHLTKPADPAELALLLQDWAVRALSAAPS